MTWRESAAPDLYAPKNCLRCGASFTPTPRHLKRPKEWIQKTFCGMSCAKLATRNAKTTTQKLRDNSRRVGDCIEYTGHRDRYGYGYIDEWRNNKRVARLKAHRASVIASGRILHPADVVMHMCDNPPCINPDHLVVGTQKQNIHDAIAKGRLNTSGLALRQVRGEVRTAGTYAKDRTRMVLIGRDQ